MQRNIYPKIQLYYNTIQTYFESWAENVEKQISQTLNQFEFKNLFPSLLHVFCMEKTYQTHHSVLEVLLHNFCKCKLSR